MIYTKWNKGRKLLYRAELFATRALARMLKERTKAKVFHGVRREAREEAL